MKKSARGLVVFLFALPAQALALDVYTDTVTSFGPRLLDTILASVHEWTGMIAGWFGDLSPSFELVGELLGKG